MPAQSWFTKFLKKCCCAPAIRVRGKERIMSTRRRVRTGRSLVLALAVSAVPIPVLAQTSTWALGPFTTGNWSVNENWSPQGVPGANATVLFVNNDGQPRMINYDLVGSPPVLNDLRIDLTATNPPRGTAPDGGANTFSMPSGILNSSNETVGINGGAIFEQKGGSN